MLVRCLLKTIQLRMKYFDAPIRHATILMIARVKFEMSVMLNGEDHIDAVGNFLEHHRTCRVEER